MLSQASVVAHACDPSTWEVGARGPEVQSKLLLDSWVQGQPELYWTFCKKQTNKKKINQKWAEKMAQ